MNEENNAKLESPTICRNIYITPLNELSAAILNESSNKKQQQQHLKIDELEEDIEDCDEEESNSEASSGSNLNSYHFNPIGGVNQSTSRTITEFEDDSLADHIMPNHHHTSANGGSHRGFSKIIEVESKSTTSTITICDEDRDSLEENKKSSTVIVKDQQAQVFKALMFENFVEEPLDNECVVFFTDSTKNWLVKNLLQFFFLGKELFLLFLGH